MGTEETEKYVPKSLRPGARAAEPAKAAAAEPTNAYRPPSMRDGSGQTAFFLWLKRNPEILLGGRLVDGEGPFPVPRLHGC